jgi:hypothetical protein
MLAQAVDELPGASRVGGKEMGKARQSSVSPRCRYPETRVPQQKSAATEDGEWLEPLDRFTPARGQTGSFFEKEDDIRTEGGAEPAQDIWIQRPVEQFVQPEQCMGGVAAAASQAGFHRNPLLEMDSNSLRDFGFGEERGGGAMDQVSWVHGEPGIAAGQLDSSGATSELEFVMDRHGKEDRFEFMETIGSTGEDVEQEIDLAGGETMVAAHSKKAPTGMLAP